MKSILVYGYGNPGRQDDGLGNAFIDMLNDYIAEHDLQHVTTDSNYQLNIEDAANIIDKDLVIFVDASIEENFDDFCVTRVEPSPKVDFTMHAVTPPFVLNLCKDIYDKVPDTYLLHIKGYEWEMKESLTPKAQENLDKAFSFLVKQITSKTVSLLEIECN